MIMPEFRIFGLTFHKFEASVLTNMIFGATKRLCLNVEFLVNQAESQPLNSSIIY